MYDELQRDEEMLILGMTFETAKEQERVRVIVPLLDNDAQPEPPERLIRLLVKSAADYYQNINLH